MNNNKNNNNNENSKQFKFHKRKKKKKSDRHENSFRKSYSYFHTEQRFYHITK